MQFLVTAYDGTDSEAPKRRLKAREAHLANGKAMTDAGTMVYGAAILSEEGAMIGSTMIVNFPSRKALEEEWLKTEPYVLGDVWRDIRIQPCRVADFK